MTYSEYRRSFDSTEEFLKEFGKLSYDEARAIVSADQAPTHIKAAMMGAWSRAKHAGNAVKRTESIEEVCHD